MSYFNNVALHNYVSSLAVYNNLPGEPEIRQPSHGVTYYYYYIGTRRLSNWELMTILYMPLAGIMHNPVASIIYLYMCMLLALYYTLLSV